MARKRPTKNRVELEDTSVPKKKFSLHDLNSVKPLTENQRRLFDSWSDSPEKSHLLLGSAGTGKTFLSFYLALLDLFDPDTPYDKIVVIRSAVQGREIGHMPGDINEKLSLYELPYYDIFDDLFKYKKCYENMKSANLLEFHCTSFLRGSTFNNSIIIFDEYQNATWEEINTVMTRVGIYSKIYICGDTKQVDLSPRKETSGIVRFNEIASRMGNRISTIHFTHSDIVRSDFVRDFIIATEETI